MTTRDNQSIRLSVTMTSQTHSGINWEGTVEVIGPMDVNEDISIEMTAITGQLAEVAEIVTRKDLVQGFKSFTRKDSYNGTDSNQTLGNPNL